MKEKEDSALLLEVEHLGSDSSLLPFIGPDGQGWPNDKVPVEIFEAVGIYLSRECLQNVRLSCKEFERKISHMLFTSIVVPFQPELFGGVETSHLIKAEHKGKGKGKSKAQLGLLDGDKHTTDGKPPCSYRGTAKNEDVHGGMKMFSDWGLNINKFGLSFEVSEELISSIPEPIPRFLHRSFWGSYEWPNENTHRYEICERLEETAVRSGSMAVAFSNLSRVSELAISVLGGLGWLSGPDISERARFLKMKLPVFRDPDSQVRKKNEAWREICGARYARRKAFQNWAFHTEFYKQLSAVVKDWNEGAGRSFITGSDAWQTAFYESTPYRAVTDKAGDFLAQFDSESNKAGGIEAWRTKRNSREHGGVEPFLTITDQAVYLMGDSNPLTGASLIPNHLTAAQKEYVLEMTFAQRAFLTSYIVAVIHNKPVFRTVCTLNVASLSSGYLPSLRQHEFWAALPNLRTLKLTLSPDWRDIFKSKGTFVKVPTIRPTTAVATLSAFLQEFISPLVSIRNLGLGWLDGGEHEIGMFGRNQHILCAPLVLQPALSHHESADNIVFFPHISQLTLNNCWITPSVLELFVQQHKTKLQDLTLGSVSLTAPVRTDLQPTAAPVQNGALEAPAQQPSLPAPGSGLAVLLSHVLSHIHRPGSWPQVIENITPGTTMAELRDGKPARRDRGALRRIHFHSCGYVLLGYMEDFSQHVIQRYVFELPEDLQNRRNDLRPAMMSAGDPMLGRIVPHMPKQELETLHALWHMSFGWGNDPRARDNLRDGQPEGGSGRFSGSVERVEGPSS